MMRGFRAVLLAAGILAAWAAPAHAQAIGSIFGKVTDASGGVLPGVTVTVTGPALQQPLVAVTSESGTYQFPSVPIGTFTVTFELASFKKARAAEHRHHDRLQRRRRSEARNRPDDGGGHDLRRVAGRRHQEDDDGRGLHGRRPREDPDGARPVADHQHDAGRAGRPQRRRLVVGPAGRPQLARHRRQRAVEPRRRIDHRPVVELLAVVLQLRLVLSKSR